MSVGGTQIIGGKELRMYSPEWYAAWDAQSASNPQSAKDAGMFNENAPGVAEAAGRAAGAKAGASVTALRAAVPDMFGNSTSSSTTASGSGTTPAPSIPRISMPSAAGPAGAAPPPPAPTGMPSGYSPAAATLSLPTTDMRAADAARFGRAKDQVGQSTRAALTGLRSAMASRGQLGGAGESRGSASIMTHGLGELADTSRQAAITGAGLDEQRAELGFTGGIQQRGQDMSAKSAADSLAERLREVSYQGDVTQRGQDLAAAQNQQSFALQEKEQQQAVLDRILRTLTPLY